MTLANITKEEWASFQERYDLLCEEEELYRLALAISGQALAIVDISNKTLNQLCSDCSYIKVGQPMPNAPDSIIATGAIHPEDVACYRQMFDSIYAGVPKGECTLRIKEEEGIGWTWFTFYYRNLFTEGGSLKKALLLSYDSTNKKKAELIYEQYYASVTQGASFVWEVSLERDFLLNADEETQKAYLQDGSTQFSKIAAKAFEVVPEKYRDRVRETFSVSNLLREFKRARLEVALDYPIDVPGAESQMWMQAVAHLLPTAEGTVNAIICVFDITKRKLDELRSRQEAEHDDLSGLYNRQAFEQRVNDLLKHDRRTKGGHLYIIDVDNFKEVNIEYGRIVGDEILQCLADTLRKCFRSEDIIGRVGGDEFMAFVRNIDSARAEQRAVEIGVQLTAICSSRDIDHDVTLSIGIAEAGQYDGFASLHNKAEKALARSKAQGNGNWTIWGE